MSENPPPVGPVTVLVSLPHALEYEAFCARIDLEPGWRSVRDAEAGPWDVRLTGRCPNGRVRDDHGPTVVLTGAEPTEPRGACACCWNVPRGAAWPSLFRVLTDAAGRAPETDGIERLQTLTRREMDVLRLVGMGKSVNQCAEALGVATSTIGNHKYRLMRKLGVTTSLQLLRIAVRHGLARLD